MYIFTLSLRFDFITRLFNKSQDYFGKTRDIAIAEGNGKVGGKAEDYEDQHVGKGFEEE